MNRADKIKAFLLYTFYPNQCVGCGATLAYDKFICPVCRHYIEYVNSEKRCIKCGFEKTRCQCSRSVYRFSGIVAPFYNVGVAQCGFYRYKFGHREGYFQFFAEEMLKCINKEYQGIDFDCVVCVPASAKRRRKFGYSPPEQLAGYIAKHIGRPFIKNALKCVNSGKQIHSLNRADRFYEVRNKFRGNASLKNKTVLLVDDILTTGATLDECARQLLFSGAAEVYCAAALITDRDAKYDKRYSDKIRNME